MARKILFKPNWLLIVSKTLYVSAVNDPFTFLCSFSNHSAKAEKFYSTALFTELILVHVTKPYYKTILFIITNIICYQCINVSQIHNIYDQNFYL